MITAIADKIIKFIKNNTVIDDDLEEAYLYGIEIIISTIINITLILLCGLIFKSISSAWVFLIVFIPLRQFTGGYHAKTYLNCNIIFTLTFLTVMFSSRFLSGIISLDIISVLLMLGFIPVYLFAPVKNPNKRITAKKAVAHRKTAMIIYGVICLLALILTVISKFFAVLITCTLIAVSCLILIGSKIEKTAEAD